MLIGALSRWPILLRYLTRSSRPLWVLLEVVQLHLIGDPDHVTPQMAPDSRLAHPPPTCTAWCHYRLPIKQRAELTTLSYQALTRRTRRTLMLPVPPADTHWRVAPALAPVVYCHVLWLSSTHVFQQLSLTTVNSLSCEACMDAIAKIPVPPLNNNKFIYRRIKSHNTMYLNYKACKPKASVRHTHTHTHAHTHTHMYANVHIYIVIYIHTPVITQDM